MRLNDRCVLKMFIIVLLLSLAGASSVFAQQKPRDPTAQAHIISYDARTGRPGDAQKVADRIKEYLLKRRGLDSSRLVTVTRGSRAEPTVELWIVPSGAQLPKPTAEVKVTTVTPTKPATPPVKP